MENKVSNDIEIKRPKEALLPSLSFLNKPLPIKIKPVEGLDW